MFIAGLGSYVPDSFSVKKAVELGLCDASMHEEVGWESVHVAGDTPAPEMAVRAAGVAMGRAGLKPADYALLLHASVSHQGPDSWTPHHYIQARTLGRHGLAIHLREGCQGMLSALDVAARYLGGSPGQPAALVTGSDNWGRPLVDRWRCQPKTVLSDAGAAMVLSRQGGFARVLSVATTCIPELEEMSRTDAPVFPPPVTLGAEMDLAPRELEVVAGRPFEDLFGEVKQGHAEVVAQALAEAGLTADDITKVCMSFVVNSRYVTNVVESLGFPSSCTSWLLEHSREFGHAGSTDPVLGLTHLVETGQVGPGDRLLVMGSTWMIARTCAVVEIVEPVDW
jgi:3-oxoacyl-[acyl-carrier-protein] synthase III